MQRVGEDNNLSWTVSDDEFIEKIIEANSSEEESPSEDYCIFNSINSSQQEMQEVAEENLSVVSNETPRSPTPDTLNDFRDKTPTPDIQVLQDRKVLEKSISSQPVTQNPTGRLSQKDS